VQAPAVQQSPQSKTNPREQAQAQTPCWQFLERHSLSLEHAVPIAATQPMKPVSGGAQQR
jgi:hypothetical protein